MIFFDTGLKLIISYNTEIVPFIEEYSFYLCLNNL